MRCSAARERRGAPLVRDRTDAVRLGGPGSAARHCMPRCARDTGSARPALQVIAQALRLVGLLAHEAEHGEEIVGAEIARRTRHFARLGAERLELRRVLAEELEGRRELHVVLLRHRLLGQFLAVEIGDGLEPDDVELPDDQVGLDVVGDLRPGKICEVPFLAVRAALELPHDDETFAVLLGRGEVFRQHHEAVEKPRLAVEPLIRQFRCGARKRRQRQGGRRSEHEIAPRQCHRNHAPGLGLRTAVTGVYITASRCAVSRVREAMLVRSVRLAILAAALLAPAAAWADDLADFNAAVEQAAAHNRVAIGYLRTGNVDLAGLEIDRLRQAWQGVTSRQKPQVFDRPLYVKTMTDIAMRLVTADMLLNMGKPDNARASL